VATGARRATAADIVASVQREIAGGGLPRESAPAGRALEKQLGLSKNTAQAAYDELVARGLVEAREREGVFVLAPSRTSAPTPIVRVPLPRLVPPPLTPPDLPARGTTRCRPCSSIPSCCHRAIAECARSVLREKMPAQYEAQGYRPLREAIAKRLSARGLDVDADDVVITTGSQQSLDIVARSLATKRVAPRVTGLRLRESCCSRASATSWSGCSSIRSAGSISTSGIARSRRGRRSRT